MFGVHLASLEDDVKKHASLLVAFSLSFHSSAHLTTVSTDVWAAASASSSVFLTARMVTSSANRELMFSVGRIFAKLLM